MIYGHLHGLVHWDKHVYNHKIKNKTLKQRNSHHIDDFSLMGCSQKFLVFHPQPMIMVYLCSPGIEYHLSLNSEKHHSQFQRDLNSRICSMSIFDRQKLVDDN